MVRGATQRLDALWHLLMGDLGGYEQTPGFDGIDL